MSTSLSSSKSAEVEVPTDLSPPVLLSRSDTAITVRLPRVENAKLYRVVRRLLRLDELHTAMLAWD